MISLIGIGISIAISVIAYVQTRDFVRRRLRYVEKVQTPIAPWIAGLAVALVGVPIAAFLPFVGIGTAVVLGASVGTAVAHGVRDIKSGGSELYLPK
ncbi:MAG: hypothetical protein ACM34L_16455 [Gemmatimonas sp.]|nr:hypothetical protein [Gemmatimonadaceae bacterium]